MKMVSTRGIAPAVSISDAIAAGLAPDGGLYMPETLPTFAPADFDGDATLAQVARRLLRPFFAGDVLEERLDAICETAFAVEPPLRAWAWMAERGGEPVGYAFATVGFSMIERAYYFNLETLFVPASARPSGIAAGLFAEARRMAAELGCVDLRWQVPAAQAAGLMTLPGQAGAATMIQYVFPTLQQDQVD